MTLSKRKLFIQALTFLIIVFIGMFSATGEEKPLDGFQVNVGNGGGGSPMLSVSTEALDPNSVLELGSKDGGGYPGFIPDSGISDVMNIEFQWSNATPDFSGAYLMQGSNDPNVWGPNDANYVLDGNNDPITCHAWGSLISCGGPNSFDMDPNHGYFLGYDSNGNGSYDSLPLVLGQGLSPTDQASVQIKVNTNGGEVYASDIIPIAGFVNQFNACVVQPTQETICPESGNKMFSSGDTSSVTIGVYDRNKTDTSQVTCANGSSLDTQNYSGTFLDPLDVNDPNMAPQTHLLGLYQSGVSVTAGGSPVSYDTSFGGWASSGPYTDSQVTFEFTLDGTTAIDEATFTVDVNCPDGISYPSQGYLNDANAGSWSIYQQQQPMNLEAINYLLLLNSN